MSTPPNPITHPSSLQYVVRAELTVDVDSVNETLKAFLERAGMAHAALFGIPLCVTSGKDGTSHVEGSAHYLGKAADIRSNDKTEAQQMLFGVVLSFVAARYGVGVYDERSFKAGEAHSTGGHWHTEVA